MPGYHVKPVNGGLQPRLGGAIGRSDTSTRAPQSWPERSLGSYKPAEGLHPAIWSLGPDSSSCQILPYRRSKQKQLD